MRETRQPRHPRLAAAIFALGKTRQDRADALNSTPKTIDRLIYNELPKQFRPFIEVPHLLRALADDLEAIQST